MYSPYVSTPTPGFVPNTLTTLAATTDARTTSPRWAAAYNGKIIQRSNSVYGEIPSSLLLIGNIDVGNSHWMGGVIEKIAVYSVAVTDEELMELTR